MQSIQTSVAGRFISQMETALGLREATAMLWPLIVGPALAASTQPLSLSGATLRVSVPDRVWQGSLHSLRDKILDALNGFWGREVAAQIDFVPAPEVPQYPRPSAPGAGLPPPRPPVALEELDPPASAIADPLLRERFLRSAQKYFTRQQELQP